MGYMQTEERIRRARKKKWCVVTQTNFRENDSQHLYFDCAYHREPEPHEFPHGIGLHYPIMHPTEVDYECEDVCEDEAVSLATLNYKETPPFMQPMTSSNKKKTRHVLVFPHRNKPPFKKPHKKTLADQCVILEPFNDLNYEGLNILQSCLTFESILDKLNSSTVYQHDTKARALALRLLLHLPPQQSEGLEGKFNTTGRVHSRVYLSARGKHHRVLTPRCDASIVEKIDRANAVAFLQKCLRGRSMQLSLEKTRERWEESFEELNGFSISYQVDSKIGMELVTYATEMTIVRAITGQYISQILQPLVIKEDFGHVPLQKSKLNTINPIDGEESEPINNFQLMAHR